MQCEEKMDFIWKSNTIEWEVVYTKERSFANWTSCSIWQYLVLVEIIYSSFISNFPFNIRLRLLKRCWAWRCVVWCFFYSTSFSILLLAFRFHFFRYFSAHTENMRFDWSYKCGFSTGDVACTLYIHNKKAFNSHLRIYNRVCVRNSSESHFL